MRARARVAASEGGQVHARCERTARGTSPCPTVPASPTSAAVCVAAVAVGRYRRCCRRFRRCHPRHPRRCCRRRRVNPICRPVAFQVLSATSEETMEQWLSALDASVAQHSSPALLESKREAAHQLKPLMAAQLFHEVDLSMQPRIPPPSTSHPSIDPRAFFAHVHVHVHVHVHMYMCSMCMYMCMYMCTCTCAACACTCDRAVRSGGVVTCSRARAVWWRGHVVTCSCGLVAQCALS